MDFQKILDKHYSCHHSLMQILTTYIFSSQIRGILLRYSPESVSYLESTFLATNQDLSLLISNTAKPNHDNQMLISYIKKFNDSTKHLSVDEKPYLNLFNNLIGVKIASRFAKNCSFFHYNKTLNYLFLVKGKHFNFYSGNSASKSKGDDWNEIRPLYRSILDSVFDYQQLNNDPYWKEYEFDKQQEKHYKLYAKLSPINRADMFYSRQSSGRILRRSRNEFPFVDFNDDQTEELLRKAYQDIFGDKAKFMTIEQQPQQQQQQQQQYQIDEYLLKIYRNFKNTNIESLLRHCCPLLPSESWTDDIIEMRTSSKQLFGFIYAIYYRIIPMEVMGSRKNFRNFNKTLKQLFTACSITKFRPWDIIYGIDVAMMKPLFKDIYKSINIFTQKMKLKCNFFVGFSARSLKYSLLFYRYDLWAKFSNQTIRRNIEEKHWQLIDYKPIEETKMQCSDLDQYLRYSSLRFIPKRKTLRPITRLRYARIAANLKFKKQASTFSALLNCLNQNYYDKQNQLSGSLLNLHQKFVNFKQNANLASGNYYVVRGDFRNCYPSINLSKLMTIIMLAIENMTRQWKCKRVKIGNYSLPATLHMQSVKLIRKKRNYFLEKMKIILYDPKSDDDDYRNEKFIVQQLGYVNLNNWIINVDRSENSSSGSGNNNAFGTEKIICLLKAYLYKTIIRLGRKSNLRYEKYGIRQGGPLSNALCRIYLNYIWTDAFRKQSFTIDKNDLFQTFADDFIFMTTSMEKAKNFLEILKLISKNFHLHINDEKLFINFDDNELKENYKVQFLGRKLTFSPELGFGIDFNSFAGQSILNTFNANPMAPLLVEMKLLIGNMHLHCYPELFDCQLNPVNAVIDNIFQRILLQAMKLASLVSKKSTTIHLASNILKFIYHLARRLFQWIKNCKIQFHLTEIQIHWISAEAVRLLWQTKMKHRTKVEHSFIKKYCRILHQQSCCDSGQKINLTGDVGYQFPKEMFFPFDQIKLR
ncbi:hypothetical protein HUG17_4210 [Dermatophagoides farinae]|uniref:Telomerase reverse transcriptase n=1 Tax=Dermatophagoides farinae TaxID=6954 RepID=A0A9D4SGV7_DERFA|nr:hypothetical protein HUG17_4210 [Dermatophagoides farinae]